MATLQVDAVSLGPCDECPLLRCLVTEQPADGPRLRVTVLAGCETCEGSTLTV